MSAKSSPSMHIDAPFDLIDTHCHLDGEDFAPDLPAVLQRATEAEVRRWINVGYSPSRWRSSIELANAYTGMSFMLGVHPGHADEWTGEVAAELRRLVASEGPVAIGEVGLDFFRGETNVDEQVAAFTDQLAIAREAGLPVSIHMRDAEELVIDVLENQPALPTLLFHSFDGSERLADWIHRHEAFIGVGGLATRSKSATLRNNIARIGLERVVLETDSPYLVPNGFKHRRNTPESIPYILRSVSDLFGVDPGTVAQSTTATAMHIFRSLPHT